MGKFDFNTPNETTSLFYPEKCYTSLVPDTSFRTLRNKVYFYTHLEFPSPIKCWKTVWLVKTFACPCHVNHVARVGTGISLAICNYMTIPQGPQYSNDNTLCTIVLPIIHTNNWVKIWGYSFHVYVTYHGLICRSMSWLVTLVFYVLIQNIFNIQIYLGLLYKKAVLQKAGRVATLNASPEQKNLCWHLNKSKIFYKIIYKRYTCAR